MIFLLIKSFEIGHSYRYFAEYKKYIIMNRIFSILIVVISWSWVSMSTISQVDYLNAVWVLNEGLPDWDTGEMVEFASVGVYNPVAQTFTQVMEFEGSSFTTDVIIAEGSVFIGADNKIVKLNLDTYEVEAEVFIEGVRKLAYYDGMIYMTRGDVDPETWGSVEFDSYLVWFDAETLTWAGELPSELGVGYASDGISIREGLAYVAINNGFAWGQEVGLLGVYNLSTGEYSEHDLGEEGKNPAHIKVTENEVLLVNNTDWYATSLSRVELPSLGAETTTVNTMMVVGVTAGCNAAAILGDEIVFQISDELGMRKASVSTLTPATNTWGPATDTYYRMSVSSVNGDVYATVTNFFDTSEVQILNASGEYISSFEAGIVPGGIAFDVRNVTGIECPEISTEVNVVGGFDVIGRVWSKGGRGLKLEKLSNGETVKTIVLTD
jgi:hypothetical protein